MTPEREREIRAACERTGSDRVDPGDSPGEMMRDLLAEIDRLRSSTGGLLLVHRHEIARAVGLPEDAPGHEAVAAVRGAIARAEQAEAALREIARWREGCHENDRSAGLEPRAFGVNDVVWLELLASRALRGGR